MNASSILTGTGILLLIQLIATYIIDFFKIPFPPALFGMILLAICLIANIIPLNIVEDTADILIGKMGLLFVPAAVGMLFYKDLISKELIPFFGTVFLSSIIVIVVTGLSVQFMLKVKGGKK